ncbi:SDR family oxidoreductase [Cupriavidus alkaliphilus]|uniref:SDR family oxidoreductase n=1 Tax=Cupriavidus alkaliphilus TaxID=942866 RepID=UPI0021ABFBB0|nr:SDR family oxidoreductase [Cupriavidus alkaliphilus]
MLAGGFHVIAGVRRVPAHDAPEAPHSGHACTASEFRAVDFARMTAAADWAPLLADVDAVVNLVGIFRETATQRFDVLHRAAPQALFDACQRQRVRLVVQMSALGADEHALTDFHRSKRTADQHLLGLGIDAVVLQPSLVFGADGTSAQLFCALATLPCLALPGGGGQPVQPVHVDDVAQAIVALLAEWGGAAPWRSGRLALVGPAPMPLAGYLQALRHSLGLRGKAWLLPLPRALARAVMPLAERATGGVLGRDALTMLDQGSVADPSALARVLGRPPRAVPAFIPPGLRGALRAQALQRWIHPLLRWSLALVWFITAAVSLGLYPVADSYALLARAGVPPALQPLALYGAALLDLAFGVLCVLPRRPRWLWLAQIALILGYTAIISVRLPEYWLHPYGPLSKNVPMLAVLWWLHLTEERAWTTSR